MIFFFKATSARSYHEPKKEENNEKLIDFYSNKISNKVTKIAEVARIQGQILKMIICLSPSFNINVKNVRI